MICIGKLNKTDKRKRSVAASNSLFIRKADVRLKDRPTYLDPFDDHIAAVHQSQISVMHINS